MILSLTFSLIFINAFGVTGTSMVLPFVAIGTIIFSFILLKRISDKENFKVNDLFSFRFALLELKKLLKVH